MNNLLNLIKQLRKKTGAGIINCKKELIKNNYNIQLAIDSMRKSGQIQYRKKNENSIKNGIITAGINKNLKFGVLIEINCETDFIEKNKKFINFSQKVLNYTLLNKIKKIKQIREKFKKEVTDIFIQTKEKININKLKFLEGKSINYYLHGSKIGVLVSSNKTNLTFTKHIAMHIAAYKPEYNKPENIPENIIEKEFQIQLAITKKSQTDEEKAKNIARKKTKKIINQISLINQYFLMNSKKTVDYYLKKNKIEIIDFVWLKLS